MEKTITLTLIFVSTLPNDGANKIHRTYTTGQKIGVNDGCDLAVFLIKTRM